MSSFTIGLHFHYPDGASLLEIEEINQEIIKAWKEHSEEFAGIMHQGIASRTPVNTGTLEESITDLTNPGGETDIAQVYFDTETQLEGPWKRVYAPYQESEPIGLPTYTRNHAQMVFRSITDDVPDIKALAQKIGQDVIDQWGDDIEYEELDEEEVIEVPDPGESLGEGLPILEEL